MICPSCQNIPLDLFLGDRSIQYKLHGSFVDFMLSASIGCISCTALLRQWHSQAGNDSFIPWHGAGGDGGSYWIEWDNDNDELVLASGWNHYYLHYDSDTGSRTRGKTWNHEQRRLRLRYT